MALPDKNEWFEEEIEPHESSLKAWLRNQFGIEHIIDDIVQIAYMRVLRAQDKGTISSPKAYLFKTARNVAIDQLKDLKKRQAEPLENHTNIVYLENWDNAKDILEHRNEVELLKASIAALPQRCREIFVMRRLHGLTSAEISRKLGISTHTVSSQLTIGLKKCTEFIERATNRPKRLQ
ncbi:RNA polymerase sigma factor [Pelagicoccus sp. SDUM812005]|uniref:RNA polymerase sigma factor n=1 Tax=Pelagicoccus sp. SDUM812005 TaxID=3041257 RepID=UPI00280D3A2F|nr:RNA polymerase sigma factor [Pelagicoccus sp. SDUM812005]MDQ8183151.1 RNA polymerase sigma factor [Pelagicoccus sp. SDUM812005]